MNLADVELIMQRIGDLEDAILRTRRFREERAKQNRKRNKKRNREQFENMNSAYTTPVPEDAESGRSK